MADQEKYLGEYPPIDTPILFKPELIPEGQLASCRRFYTRYERVLLYTF